MPKLTVLIGPPGSGKSTLAASLVELDTASHVNQDLQGKDGHIDFFHKLVSYQRDIVVDRMNFSKKQRSRYIDLAKSAGYRIEIHVLHEASSTCLNRCINRENHPTIKTEQDAKKALAFFFRHYEKPEPQEADEIINHYPNYCRGDAIICDLDGTLCNIDHRLHWVRRERKNWDMFFAGISRDEPNKWCSDLLKRYEQENIILCSGRSQNHEPQTIAWLSDNMISYTNLFMRPNGDYRRDDIVKEIILDFEILTRYNPVLFIDDRQQVVDMWRRRGYTCLQCAKGDF
jgi:predicted kinase